MATFDPRLHITYVAFGRLRRWRALPLVGGAALAEVFAWGHEVLCAAVWCQHRLRSAAYGPWGGDTVCKQSACVRCVTAHGILPAGADRGSRKPTQSFFEAAAEARLRGVAPGVSPSFVPSWCETAPLAAVRADAHFI